MNYYTQRKRVLEGLISLAEFQKQMWLQRCKANVDSLDKIIEKRRAELKRLEEKYH